MSHPSIVRSPRNINVRIERIIADGEKAKKGKIGPTSGGVVAKSRHEWKKPMFGCLVHHPPPLPLAPPPVLRSLPRGPQPKI